jgi:hypothetical protein
MGGLKGENNPTLVEAVLDGRVEHGPEFDGLIWISNIMRRPEDLRARNRAGIWSVVTNLYSASWANESS